jgi:hypothetical protein
VQLLVQPKAHPLEQQLERCWVPTLEKLLATLLVEPRALPSEKLWEHRLGQLLAQMLVRRLDLLRARLLE